MTRYVCSWCGRNARGEVLSTCVDCSGPLEPSDLLHDQQQAAREGLRKATVSERLQAEARAAMKADKQARSQGTGSAHPGLPHPAYRYKMAQVKQEPSKPLPPPIPRKPKPLVLRSPPPSGLAPE